MDLFDDLPPPKNENSSVDEASSKDNSNKRTLQEDDETSDGSVKKKCSSQESTCATNTDQTTTTTTVKAYVAERIGERDSMQDRHVLIEDFSQFLKKKPDDLKNISYFAIFDGHAGSRAADYCAKNLHTILAEQLSKPLVNNQRIEDVEKEIKRHFIEAFKRCDDEFLKIAAKNKPSWKDGTTASIILIINTRLYSANIGDSKAIIYGVKDNKDDVVIELTTEHNALNFEERTRIHKSGGNVKDGRVLGVLDVSRSIGDGQFKPYGVNCIPDMRKCQLNSFYRYVLLACDGLWKTFKNQEAVDFVNNLTGKYKPSNEGLEPKSNPTISYETCCNKLANEAVKKLTADNVTVMIITINVSN